MLRRSSANPRRAKAGEPTDQRTDHPPTNKDEIARRLDESRQRLKDTIEPPE